MGWFSKKKTEIETPKEQAGEGDESEESKPQVSGSVEADLTKIKSSLEALNEVRKANADQFTRTSEQIGELRGALMDTNKAVGTIEVASSRAIDLVNTVQPDKLMIEVRKMDGKLEALRANIEANETIMKDIMREMKEIRGQMGFYKGVDQVVKMNNEIKQELIEIKKTEGIVGKHADKVETIFVEVEKKFYDFEKFNDAVKELDRAFRKISSDFDKTRVTVDEKADKKEFVKVVDKFTDFEKHTSNILKLLDQKSRTTVVELNNSFDSLKKQLEKKLDKKIELKPLTVDDKPADAAAAAQTPAAGSAPVDASVAAPATAPAVATPTAPVQDVKPEAK
jgi:predicted  nucleic acid-binding Zn-ribbon protein